MNLVIADTGPIQYLIQIGQIEVLPLLFERVAIPAMVRSKLSHPLAPLPVLAWIQEPPTWLEIHDTSGLAKVTGLDAGETDAIALAIAVHADLILIDERAGFSVAQQRGLHVTGTLGVLDLAAERGLIDFAAAIVALEQTSFRRPGTLLRVLLANIECEKKAERLPGGWFAAEEPAGIQSRIGRERKARVLGHHQLTDAVLRDLAIRNQGRLATLDRRVAGLLARDSRLDSAVAIIPV